MPNALLVKPSGRKANWQIIYASASFPLKYSIALSKGDMSDIVSKTKICALSFKNISIILLYSSKIIFSSKFSSSYGS